MLLQLTEREHQLLLEVLGSALRTLREVETPEYESIQREREGLMLGLRLRLTIQPADSADTRGGRASTSGV
jgi:hypothetical protein